MRIRAVVIFGVAQPPGNLWPPDFDPDRTVPVRLEGFLNQAVMCLENEWVSRGDVIEYIANVASGVHSDSPKERSHQILRRIRFMVTYSREGGLRLNRDSFRAEDPPFEYNPQAIDLVLFELLATAGYLIASDDIKKLEDVVRAELMP